MRYAFSLVFVWEEVRLFSDNDMIAQGAWKNIETDIKSVLALETNLPHIDHITSKNIENNTGTTKNLFQKIHLPQW